MSGEEGAYRAKYETLVQEYEDYKTMSHELEEEFAEQLKEKDAEINRLKSELGQETDQAKEYRGRLSKTMGETQSLRDTISSLKEENSTMKSERVQLENDLDRTQRKSREMEFTLNKLETDTEDALERSLMMESENTDVKGAYRQLQLELAHLREELDEARRTQKNPPSGEGGGGNQSAQANPPAVSNGESSPDAKKPIQCDAPTVVGQRKSGQRAGSSEVPSSEELSALLKELRAVASLCRKASGGSNCSPKGN